MQKGRKEKETIRQLHAMLAKRLRLPRYVQSKRLIQDQALKRMLKYFKELQKYILFTKGITMGAILMSKVRVSITIWRPSLYLVAAGSANSRLCFTNADWSGCSCFLCGRTALGDGLCHCSTTIKAKAEVGGCVVLRATCRGVDPLVWPDEGAEILWFLNGIDKSDI